MIAALLSKFGGWLLAGLVSACAATGVIFLARHDGKQAAKLDQLNDDREEANDANKAAGAVDGMSADAVQRGVHGYDAK